MSSKGTLTVVGEWMNNCAFIYIEINVLLLLCAFLIRIKINVRKSKKGAKFLKVIMSPHIY